MALREWELHVCPTCGEAVTVDDYGPEPVYCTGGPEKHRIKKMEVVRVRER